MPEQRFLLRLLFTVAILVGVPAFALANERQHALLRAIRHHDDALVEGLLRQGTPADLSAQGTTGLVEATRWGNAAAVRHLLEAGADPDLADARGATPLISGAGSLEMVRLLLNAGADPNLASQLGNTPLITASAYPSATPILELLVQHGAKIDVANVRGITPLRNAIMAGDASAVRFLIEHGHPPRSRANSTSNLALAAEYGNIEIVRLLLEHGADPNASGGRHSLHSALLSQRIEIAQLLIEHGANFDRRLQPGNVPSILLSAYNEIGDLSVAKMMVAADVDLNVHNGFDETVITWAGKRGHTKLVDLILRAGAEGHDSTQVESPDVPSRQMTLGGESDQAMLIDAIARSIPLLQRSSDVFMEKRESCVSCHHQNIPAMAIGMAADRGFTVDQGSVDRMIQGQQRSWRPRIQRAYEMDRPVPVAPRFIGYGLLGFAAIGYAPDELTDAMAWYLANIQQPDGRWVPGMMRPPLGGGEILATAVALRSLQLYVPTGQRQRFQEHISQAREWLWQSRPQTHQERVFKLMGLAWAGVASSELAELVDPLLDEQRTDGGWAQLPGLSSDAWATGQTLVALRTAAALPAEHPAVRSGMEFLLSTQFDDGSWYVQHRSWPFQSHFESEFPHGRDQWLSAPATAWAVMALTLAVDPGAPAAAAQLAGATPTDPVEVETEVRREVNFHQEIQPLLRTSCLGCHRGEDAAGGLRLTSRAELLTGGDSGEPAIVPGESEAGLLIPYVTGRIEDFEMPPLAKRNKYPGLSGKQVERLKAWLEQGAPWPEREQ